MTLCDDSAIGGGEAALLQGVDLSDPCHVLASTTAINEAIEIQGQGAGDPRFKEVSARAAVLSEQLRDKLWEVVGEGIDVYDALGSQRRSPTDSLVVGSIIRELAVRSGCMKYELLDGDGPRIGWASLNLNGSDAIAKVEENSEIMERVNILIRRLAMLPSVVLDIKSQNVQASMIDKEKCHAVTDQLYGRKGYLREIHSELWCSQAVLPSHIDPVSAYPDFPSGDSILSSLIANRSLAPLQRVFPRPPGHCTKKSQFPQFAHFAKAVNPVDGLLPDAMAVAYFKHRESNMLRGVVRFGPQSTGSMSREIPDEEGETTFNAHGGAIACVLYDAALSLARLSASAAASPQHLFCQIGKGVPMLTTLEIEASLPKEEDRLVDQCTVKVFMRDYSTQLARAEVTFCWDPKGGICDLPGDLPRQRALGDPCLDWVPRELAKCCAPKFQTWEGWNAQSYQEASFDMEKAMKFPKSCAPVDDGWEFRSKGLQPQVRANRPPAGGPFRNDLAFSAGLTPAAISFTKWSQKRGRKAEGVVKFGPQASDAWFLQEGGHSVASDMALVAHYGMVLAVLDDWAAHLPRIKPGLFTLTWQLSMHVHGLVPLGHEMRMQSWLVENAKMDVDNTVLVRNQLLEDGKVLVSVDATLWTTTA